MIFGILLLVAISHCAVGLRWPQRTSFLSKRSATEDPNERHNSFNKIQDMRQKVARMRSVVIEISYSNLFKFL